MHRVHTLTRIGLLLPLCGCNPLVFDKILEDAPVEDFEIKGPDGRPAVGLSHIVYEEVGDDIGHLLTAGPINVALSRIALSEGAEPIIETIERDVADELIFPLESRTTIAIGGLFRVPSPTAGDEAEHAVGTFVSSSERRTSRIVRFNASNFERTDDSETDIVVPEIAGTTATGWGSGLAAVNLDDDQSNPDYELAVGSDSGVLVYDNMGVNIPTYADTHAMIRETEPDAFDPTDPAKDADGRFFTLCDNLAGFNGLTAGPFLAAGEQGFVVGTSGGLVMIAEQEGVDPADAVNRVGAPIYDCAREQREAPSDASDSLGQSLFLTDFNGDGALDLVVGDPGANRVFLYEGSSDGLAQTPVDTLQPGGDTAGSAKEFGAGLGRANLDPSSFEVLVVGAPGTAVDGKGEVGSVHVFELGSNEWVVTLEDRTPSSGTRHGTWAGGLWRDGRDELIVIGELEGRVHSRIVERDPKP